MRSAGLSPESVGQMGAMLDAVRCDIQELRDSLQLEHGRVPAGVRPHNVAQLPLFHAVELEADQLHVFDVEGSLGKFCTRGHLANIGAVEVALQFQGVAGDEWSGTYVLPAGAALETGSFAYRKVRARAAGGAGRLQLLAQ